MIPAFAVITVSIADLE